LEAVSDALRRELNDVAVIVIEPGMTSTKIWAEGTQRGKELEDQMRPDQQARYRPLLEALRRASARGAEQGLPVAEVAEVIVNAAQSPSPRTRYLVGKEARWIGRLERSLPDRMPGRGIKRGMGLSPCAARS
jgi:NAD(P)-dependent dehydrogenase (short-subunit alcohol dehydrogenase family)